MTTRPILLRHRENPILSPATMPFECYAVFNAGAIRFQGRYLLLLRVSGMDGINKYHTALSDDGVHFTVNPQPIDYPLDTLEKEFRCRRGFRHHQFEMRITAIDGTYYLYHAVMMDRTGGCCIVMAQTDDFIHFRQLPYLSVPENRNAALFPEKIGGLYARLERPMSAGGRGTIWISYSPDLQFWGRSRPLEMPSLFWSRDKTGPGNVPIKTDRGWLVIYHATAKNASAENYYLGAMLLDLEDPSRTIGYPRQFILAPQEIYECVGQVPNVVFTAGTIVNDDGTLNVYYGGADTVIALAQGNVQELVDLCLANPP
jgi:beta-1,4-mannooligosaccharide/beta-1,4-mannosyl-N-acetylglucosamine phosphorylase